jgi:adenylosuccinate synthase
MALDVLLGLQWGDEGKGKVVDVFTPKYDIVARFQGGPNAGHTIEFDGAKYVLHLIPSGIFHPGAVCLIGNGVVVDPVVLRREVTKLMESGQDVRSRLLLARRANLILPTHKFLDAASEQSMGEQKIGSTLKGIGPTYRDKIGRTGLRVGDLFRADFLDMYRKAVDQHVELLRHYAIDYDLPAAEKDFFEAVEFVKDMQVVDCENYLQDALAAGKSILAEGAQGTMLDIDLGSYPYVTSSNTITAGACTGLGVAPSQIRRVFGIFKAYCTRVGGGPFPSELNDAVGETIRQAGREFGSTTGRPRRTGWLDLVALRYAIRINGVTDLIMTKADVLSVLDEVKVATAYRIDGAETNALPYDLSRPIELVLQSFPAWPDDVTGARQPSDLPATLASYIRWIEETVGVPITLLSVGPDREQTFEMQPLGL